MNYLAHLHLAQVAQSSLLGNLLGDFVRGDPSEQYPRPIVEGILLHRHVDIMTDTHPLLKEIKALFRRDLRRFVPIAMDMVWDHCLASHWEQYHSRTIEDFVVNCEIQIEKESQALILPTAYQSVSDKIWSQQWLLSYQDFDNICYAIERISLRRKVVAPLAECVPVIEQHRSLLMSEFDAFYRQIIKQTIDAHDKIRTQ